MTMTPQPRSPGPVLVEAVSVPRIKGGSSPGTFTRAAQNSATVLRPEKRKLSTSAWVPASEEAANPSAVWTEPVSHYFAALGEAIKPETAPQSNWETMSVASFFAEALVETVTYNTERQPCLNTSVETVLSAFDGFQWE